jgi:filamentous hemagglutinin
MVVNDPNISEAELRVAAKAHANTGGHLKNIPPALEAEGISASYKGRITLDELKIATTRGPAIVGVGEPGPWSGSHAIVVDGFENGRVLIRDPWPVGKGSAYAVSESDFLHKWRNGAVVINP